MGNDLEQWHRLILTPGNSRYTALVWSLKACMLCFYDRLTLGLGAQRWVKTLAIAVGLTYIATFLTVTLGCLPIQRNWQISPTPPLRCTLKPQNFYVCTILNVLTDAAMLAIPLPILWHLKVPLRRKLALGAMLCSGIFVITAAIVRIVETLSAHPSVLNVNRWGIRETIAGVIAINIPILRPREPRSIRLWCPVEAWLMLEQCSGKGSGLGTCRTRTAHRRHTMLA